MSSPESFPAFFESMRRVFPKTQNLPRIVLERFSTFESSAYFGELEEIVYKAWIKDNENLRGENLPDYSSLHIASLTVILLRAATIELFEHNLGNPDAYLLSHPLTYKKNSERNDRVIWLSSREEMIKLLSKFH